MPYRRETFVEKHAIIEFNSDFNMVDAGFMSNQSSSKDMRMLQADIDSMKVQNDSIGRTYYKEAMASTYKATVNTLSKDDTLKNRIGSFRQLQCGQSVQCGYFDAETENNVYGCQSCRERCK